MTRRSVFLGLLLGVAISATTYFNDFVIGQTSLIGHLLPLSVFGFGLLLVLVINPLLSRLGRGAMLGSAEVSTIVLLGLAACTWPGAGFFRTATAVVAMPGYFYPTEPSWRAGELMSYVPGGSARIAPGQVSDWGEVGRSLKGLDPVYSRLTPQSRRVVAALADGGQSGRDDLRALLDEINDLIQTAALSSQAVGDRSDRFAALPPEAQAENRRWLVAQTQGLLPMPAGDGLLLAGGRADPAVHDTLISGGGSLGRVAWSAWWPTIRLWSVLALTIGLASLCLALIVHPQWSERELLPYPIARFFIEASARTPGRLLPAVCHDRLFLLGFCVMAAVHLLNGLAAWFEALPKLPLQVDLRALEPLFPQLTQVSGFMMMLEGPLFPTVIAFTLFLNRSVSLSLGIAPLAFAIFAAALIASGTRIDDEYLDAGKSNLLRFGAFVAAAGMIFYTGRHYYLSLMRASLRGERADEPTPTYAVWAARVLAMIVPLAIVWLHRGLGLDWLLATGVVLLILMTFLVLARIAAETGLFFIQPFWMPVAILTALFGFDALGPTAYISLALVSTMIVGDTRTALICNLLNGLQISQRSGGPAPGRLWVPVVLMVIVGFLVAGVATLWVQQRYGLMNTDNFTRIFLPKMPFDRLAAYQLDAQGRGTLADSLEVRGLQRIVNANLQGPVVIWTLIGFGLFLTFAAARLRLPWWPLHPVIFLVWGTFPIHRFAFSFLIGWLVKAAVMQLGGVRAFRKLIPLAIGIICGELLMGLGWIGVGFAYFVITGQNPRPYNIF